MDDETTSQGPIGATSGVDTSSHHRQQQQTIATLTARVAALEAALAAEQAKSAELERGLGAYSFVLQQQFAAQARGGK
jgi:uncharacterized protein YaiL (DUF2058 family)